LVTTATTDSAGAASVTYVPAVNTEYRWRYAGDETHDAATSSVEHIKVRPALTIHRTAARVRAGQSMLIYGTASPHAKGETAYLEIRSGKTWLAFDTVRIAKQQLPDGQRTIGYSIAFGDGQRGSMTLRVHLAATSSHAAVSTRGITVTTI
jgi:hypothetical protein